MSAKYASGEVPAHGDVVRYKARDDYAGAVGHIHPREHDEIWVVTRIAGDMVRAKVVDAPLWRQAHYTKSLVLIRRQSLNGK
jgi:hypothetical protein